MAKRQNKGISLDKALIVILLVGFIVRLVGIPFGLPYLYHVDEARFAKISLNYFTGDLNPHFFHVPTLHTYAVAGIWAIYYHLGKISGKFANVTDFMDSFQDDPTVFILLGRLLTVLLSVGTIALVYIIGTKMYNRRAGIFAALFLTFSHVHNKISHYQVPDAPMVFFFMLSFLFIWHIYKRGKPKDYILAGLFAGLAMATKYGGQMLFLPLLLAHLFRKIEEKQVIQNIVFSLPLVLSGFFFGLGFLIGCPYFMLDFASFWRGFQWQSKHLYVEGHFGSSTAQPAWLFYIKQGFRENVGLLSQFLVLGGMLYGFVKHKKREILLFSLPAVLFVIIGGWKAKAVRYMLPLTPFLALIAGYFLDFVLHKIETFKARSSLAARQGGKNSILLPVLLLSLILFPSAYKVFRFDLSLTQKDTRTLSKEWINNTIPEGSHIACESYCPPISENMYDRHYRHTLGQVTLEYLTQRGTQYVVISDIMYSRFLNAPDEFPRQARFYKSLNEQAMLIKTFEPAWNEKLIDLHNPTIKIYKLSRYPNFQFPGNFHQYAQKIILTRISKNRWKIRSDIVSRGQLAGNEVVKNPYVKLLDPQQKELIKLTVHDGAIPIQEEITFTKSKKFSSPVDEWEIRLGYEYELENSFKEFDIKSPLTKEYTLPQKTSAKGERPFHKQEYLFLYSSSPNQGDSKYFQVVILSKKGQTAQLFSHIFGSKLRWGEGYVENPYVQIMDLKGRELARLVVYEGKLGERFERRGQAKKSMTLPSIPETYKVYVGFESYNDGGSPPLLSEKSSGDIIMPSESEG
jgi:4-amino-4-deoxy-L-arabinose transferase-like glycosyltransferase